jgi:hypothetical protein
MYLGVPILLAFQYAETLSEQRMPSIVWGDSLIWIIVTGSPGVGKNHAGKIVGCRGCQTNHRVPFSTALDMPNHMLASQVDHALKVTGKGTLLEIPAGRSGIAMTTSAL